MGGWLVIGEREGVIMQTGARMERVIRGAASGAGKKGGVPFKCLGKK